MTAKGLAHLGAACLLVSITRSGHAMTADELLISELMVNPAAVSDTRGEWFELYNPTPDIVNLRGTELGDDGGDSHRIESDLLILPGHFLTLGRNGDPSVNGGYTADYVYRDFTLSNSGDEIVLRAGTRELLRLDYGAGFDSAGRSRELIGLPAIEGNYGLTLASLQYGLGDIGTPGSAGSVNFGVSSVPLPAAAWLFASGLMAIFTPGLIRRRGVSSTGSGLRPVPDAGGCRHG